MKMLAQSITTQNSEPPLIATGHENIKDDSPLALKWERDIKGEVMSVDEFNGKIKIKLTTGEIVGVNIPTPIEVQKDMSINFIPPQVGQILSKGDLVYHSDNLAPDGQLRLGQNLRTAFMYYHGLEFEDSVAISESCSKKLTHIGEKVLFYDIKEGESVEKLMEPGMLASALTKHYLISVKKELNYTRAQEGLNNLVRVNHSYTKEVGLRVPNNLVETIIADVQYKEFIPDLNVKKRLDSVVRLNINTNPNSKVSKFTSKHGEIRARKIKIPTQYNKLETKGVSYRVFFKLIIASPAKDGDKVTNR